MNPNAEPASAAALDTGGEFPAAWLDRLKNQDAAAFEDLVRRFAPRMLAVITRILGPGEDCHDALQEAFISALRGLPAFQGQAKLSTWLHRIAVNAALIKLRTRRRHPEEDLEALLPKFDETGHPLAWPEPWQTNAQAALESAEVRQTVRAAIERLPEAYRTVLVLRDIEEMDNNEIAAMLGMTPNAVKVRVHRARQALRTLLDPHFRASKT